MINKCLLNEWMVFFFGFMFIIKYFDYREVILFLDFNIFSSKLYWMILEVVYLNMYSG